MATISRGQIFLAFLVITIGLVQTGLAEDTIVVAKNSSQVFDPFPNNIGNWSVSYPWPIIKKTCILLAGAIQLQFPSVPGENSTIQTVDVPGQAEGGGECNQDSQFQIMWTIYDDDTNANGKDYRLSFYFAMDEPETNTYHVNRISLSVQETNPKPNGKGYLIEVESKGEFYATNLNQSYQCHTHQTIVGDLTVLTSDFQVEAFRPRTAPTQYEFDPPTVCKADNYTPKPFPQNVGKWAAKCDKSTDKSKSCILLTGALQLGYSVDVDNTTVRQKMDVPVSAVAKMYEEKNSTRYNLQLSWPKNKLDDSEDERHYNLRISFMNPPEDKEKYYIDEISFSIHKSDDKDKNASEDASKGQGGQFVVWTKGKFYSTNLNHSYLCHSEQTIRGNLNLATVDLQFEAFRPTSLKEFQFDTAEQCIDPPTTTTIITTASPTPPTNATTTTKPTPPTNSTTTTKPTPPTNSTTTTKPTPPTNSTTTAKPTTPTTISTLKPSTTTTPTPEPSFPKNVGNWSYGITDNSSCILLAGALRLEFNTTTKNTTTTTTHNIDIPRNAKISAGFCGDANTTVQSVVLSWMGSDLNVSLEYHLAVNFSIGSKDNKTKTDYHISELHLTAFPSGQSVDSGPLYDFRTDGDFYPTPLHRSFKCSSEQNITGNLTVQSADLHYEAFRPMDKKKYDFSDGEICQADTPKPSGSSGWAIFGYIMFVFMVLGLATYLGIRYGLFHKLRTRCCPNRQGQGYQSLHTDT